MSANFFNGYNAEKPTSRVLNPPGGRSNNIFGTPEEHNVSAPSNGHVVKSAKEEAAANKSSQNSNFTLYDSSSAPTPTITGSHRGTGVQPKDNSQSNIFGDVTKDVTNKQGLRRGYNTITGKLYEDEEVDRQKAIKEYNTATKTPAVVEQTPATNEQQVHTSSRVSQPPGGRSTKLW